jgi:hypothetical protein
MKQQTYPSEYAPPIILKLNHWLVHKFCSHHGTYLDTYDIKIDNEGFYCSCKAGRNCKHIHMVTDTLRTKKDLF